MGVTSRYQEAWEGFWSEAPPEAGGVFWDSEPALTAGIHLALFEPHLTAPDLPMVDLFRYPTVGSLAEAVSSQCASSTRSSSGRSSAAAASRSLI